MDLEPDEGVHELVTDGWHRKSQKPLLSYVDGEERKEITVAVAFRSYNTSLDCTVMVLKTELLQLIKCVSLRCGRSREKKIECGSTEGEKDSVLDIG